MPVKEGDKVKVEYEGKLDDGTVFDSSEKHGGKPLEFQIGSKQVIPGFEKALIGMEKGEEKEIKLKPAEAYGDPNPELVKKIPKDKLPTDKELKPGMMLSIGLPTGQQIPARITEIGDKEVTIDLNHPLAGKNLNFKLKVVDISS
ncbi:peptidylprolyl isomerase [Candidatus Woesearchaeota archaeon]|nr:peptidylprolyl isomerase [Candidatus Woesearchaeota archaeon]